MVHEYSYPRQPTRILPGHGLLVLRLLLRAVRRLRRQVRAQLLQRLLELGLGLRELTLAGVEGPGAPRSWGKASRNLF